MGVHGGGGAVDVAVEAEAVEAVPAVVVVLVVVAVLLTLAVVCVEVVTSVLVLGIDPTDLSGDSLIT